MRAPTAGEGSVLVLRSGGWRGEVGGGCVICGFLEKMYVDKRVDMEAIGFPTICVIVCVFCLRNLAGMAIIWDNKRFLHSTTPVAIYTKGRRVMYQIIQHAFDPDAHEEDESSSESYDRTDVLEPEGDGDVHTDGA